MATIKWTRDKEDGDRHAEIDGIKFTICRALDHGQHVFQLSAYRDGEAIRRLGPCGWGPLRYAIHLAEEMLVKERAKQAG